jgi:uncharacterized membrane protein
MAVSACCAGLRSAPHLSAMTDSAHPASPTRLIALDAARTLAILCMVVFHFTFDLALFGHIPSDTMYQPFWYYFARMIAGSFLFLAGVSLWLAHGQGVSWPAFGWRMGKLVAAAALVTVASLWFVPGGPIWFGILHAIAAASLVGLIVLRLPWPVTLALALGIFALAWGPRSAIFDPLWLVWTGLAENRPAMGDYVPLVPWAAPLMAGVALAKAFQVERWSRRRPSRGADLLTFPGRHSLVIYLLHQPILVGLFYLWSLWMARAAGG